MKKQYHHGDLRQALIQNSLETLEADQDISALSLRKLAQQLDVSPSAVYRHFESKEHLLAAVAVEGFRLLIQAMEAVSANPDPGQYLQALGQAYLGFAHRHPRHFRVMFSHYVRDREQYADLEAVTSESFGQLHRAVQTCFSAATPQAVMHHTIGAWSKVHGLSMLSLEGQFAFLKGFPAFDMADILNVP